MRRHCSGPRQFLPAHARRTGGLPAAGAAEGGRGISVDKVARRGLDECASRPPGIVPTGI